MPPATYENFDVLIGRVAIDYQTRLLYSPAGEAAIEFTSPFSESETAEFRAHWSGAQPAALALDATGRRFDARAFGTRLYQAAFAGPIDLCLQRSLDETARRQAGLRIRLRLDQSLDGAANLPWELLYAPSLGRFLAQSDLTPIVRYVESPRPVQPLRLIHLSWCWPSSPIRKICPHWLWNRSGGPCRMRWRIWSALAWLFSNGWNPPRCLHCKPVCAGEWCISCTSWDMVSLTRRQTAAA